MGIAVFQLKEETTEQRENRCDTFLSGRGSTAGWISGDTMSTMTGRGGKSRFVISCRGCSKHQNEYLYGSETMRMVFLKYSML